MTGSLKRNKKEERIKINKGTRSARNTFISRLFFLLFFISDIYGDALMSADDARPENVKSVSRYLYLSVSPVSHGREQSISD